MFSGEAIGESLRNLSRAAVLPGDILMIFTNLVFLYIWWQTLRAPHHSYRGVILCRGFGWTR
ncbi:MAG: hypothetical protein ACLQU1_07600 [Bryobacteraceae bacterium]